MTARVRLSLAVPPEGHQCLADRFESTLSGLLARFGLPHPHTSGRPQIRGRFVRLFDLERPDPGLARRLESDPGWRAAMAALASRFGVDPAGFWELSAYSATAGPGRTVECGSGSRHGVWHGLGVQDGLPSSLILGLAEDGEDHLWLRTRAAGICRYDGGSFTTFTAADGLTHDEVLFLCAAPGAAGVWALTQAGLCRFDGSTFRTYTVDDGLPGPGAQLSILATPGGGLWAGGPQGLAWFDGTIFQPVACGAGTPEVICLTPGPDASVWIGTDGQGVWSCPPRPGLPTCEAAPEALPEATISDLRFDRQGRPWLNLGDRTGILEGGRFLPVSPPGRSEARFMVEDRRGLLWFTCHDRLVACSPALAVRGQHRVGALVHTRATEDRHGQLWLPDPGGGGLLRFDAHTLVRYTTREGLGHNRVYTVLEARDGNLWVGSWGGGLDRYNGYHFTSYTRDEGLPSDEVEAIATDASERLWFATRTGGACCWDGSGFTRLSTADGLGSNFVWCVTPDTTGRLWFGTDEGGASCLDETGLHTFTTRDGLAHDCVWQIVEDHRGRLWFTTQGAGICRLDGESFTCYGVEDGLPHPWVWSAVEDAQGHMWFATSAGVSCFDGQTFATYTTADGLAHDSVWCCLRARDDRLWFGTWGGGVSVWNPQNAGFTTFTTADGLTDNNVRSISEDAAGRLWFSTYGGGVCLYDGQVFQALSRQDGLLHDAVQDVHFDAHGRAWIATEAGVTCYRQPTSPPRVRRIDVIADESYDDPDKVVISTSQKFIIFEFRGSSFATPPGRLVYVYRLRGFDDSWRTTRRRRVEYGNLPVGAFRFEVRAVDRDLNYSAVCGVDLTVVQDVTRDRMEALQAHLSQPPGLEQFIGASPALQRVLEQARTVAATDLTVLILGETGTGKGLAARAIHAMSGRAAAPFLHVNCGALPEGLIESELFGHEKGAFTGALARKIGRFELADGGTLFLDEIGDLPLESQQVLLEVLQEGTFQRVGGRQVLRGDVRVIAATNRDLAAAMQGGAFRQDLYYRLSAFVLQLPALRQRRADIRLLAEHFIERFARHLNRPVPRIDATALEVLAAHPWPGNVRELEHVIQRAVLVHRDQVLLVHDLFPETPAPSGDAEVPAMIPGGSPAGLVSLDEHQQRMAAQERQLIEAALRASHWVVYGERGAARLLDTHPEKLRARMRRLGIRRPD